MQVGAAGGAGGVALRHPGLGSMRALAFGFGAAPARETCRGLFVGVGGGRDEGVFQVADPA